jgi:hypothetical protein
MLDIEDIFDDSNIQKSLLALAACTVFAIIFGLLTALIWTTGIASAATFFTVVFAVLTCFGALGIIISIVAFFVNLAEIN